jgi:hypothetical protein
VFARLMKHPFQRALGNEEIIHEELASEIDRDD